MTVRTRVYELPITKAQVMVEDWADGTQTIALREDSSAIWGPKFDPTIDDDGDHLRAPEHRVFAQEAIARADAALDKLRADLHRMPSDGEFPGEVLTAEQTLESHDIEEYRRG